MEQEVQNLNTAEKKITPGAKVLLIEDDEMLSGLIAMRFRAMGYNISVAPGGKEGLEAIDTEKPDVILLDLIMPGMSGFEVLKELKKRPELCVIPVIVCSNISQQSQIDEARRLGAVDFLVKAHITPNEMVTRVSEILKK